MSFRFRMFLEDGTDLDDYVTARPDWDVGHELEATRGGRVISQLANGPLPEAQARETWP